jgi:Protein of unknown function (DUF2946)
MKWFRRRIKTGSRLALFALLLQFVLSFGHFHFNAAQAAPAIQTLTDLAHAQGLAADAASERQQGGNPDTDQPSGEPCAICAVMSMANQLVFATPALLLLPDAIEVLFLVTDAEFAHLGSLWPAFQSRAPPVS